ncbi:MAG: cell division protein FtsL [Oceanospirillaceae bacterium]|nr:cell division protein FtsL [Oceanospirillaceae bacterium]|tara:strand:+ start:440 stop:685 length:246 start_codon:yes stop_codon:yes gene_type:complete
MNALVWFAVLVSALVQVGVSHWNRDLVGEWLALEAQQRELNQEQTRLLLEHSTLTAYGRIDQNARKQLDMIEPANIRVLTQ